MAYVIDWAFESRGSVMPDQLKCSSGVYYILTSGDRYYNRFSCVADEVAGSCFRTTDKEKALAYWREYTANHWSENQ